MVATRRQIQTAPDVEMVAEQDPDQILKKKPGRKPTAKAATTTTANKVDTKAKTTVRGRKKETEPVEEEPHPTKAATKQTASRARKVAIVPENGEDGANDSKKSRTTKTGSVRSTRGATLADEVPEPAQIEAKASKSTKPSTVRGRKAATLAEEAPVLAEKKQAASTKTGSVRGKKGTTSVAAPALPAPEEPKPTRQTRAAATKAAPLSPKKITQVTKPTRSTRNASQKPATKPVALQSTVNARGTTKKRTVSDENAELIDFDAAEGNHDDEIVVMHQSTPVNGVSRVKNKIESQAIAESEASMSSRPTTPNDSLVQSFNTVEEQEDKHDENESITEEGSNAQDDGEASEDELCGPKTPMKRSSPTAHARYQSTVQRTIRKYEDEIRMETPARRFVILGSQLGTPQTQRPYCKPTAPASGSLAMTVGRAAGRAFVFKDLGDAMVTPSHAEQTFEDQEDVSFLPDEDIIPIDESSAEDQAYLQSYQISAGETNGVPEMPNMSFEDDEDDYVNPAEVQKFGDDVEDTVIVHDADEDVAVTFEQPAESFETDDSVIITRAEAIVPDVTMSDVSESEEGSIIMHSTPADIAPEFTPLQKTITVNFDEHLGDVRSPVRAAIDSPSAVSVDDINDAVAGAEMDIEPLDHVDEIEIKNVDLRRETVNFTEFIDVGALAEPTAQIQIDLDCSQARTAVSHSQVEHTEDVNDVPAAPIMQAAREESIHHELESPPFEDTGAAAMDVDDEITPTERTDVVEEPQIPHYALPTIAYDARRKSLPALSHRTPVKTGTRPNTSDGASIPRIANPFANAWWARSRAGSTAATPVKARPSTAHATPNVSSFNTPVRSRFSNYTASPAKTPQRERYPLLPVKTNYDGRANTVAAPARFATPSAKSPKRRETFHKAISGNHIPQPVESVATTPASTAAVTPKERYPALGSRSNYEEHANTMAPVRFQVPPSASPKRRQTFHRALAGRINEDIVDSEPVVSSPIAPVTPVPATTERFPRLRPRQDYEEHAKTVAGPVRFQTPAKTSLKRPATIGKSDTLRKAALFANTPIVSHSPTKTPLKAAAMTPSQVPLTPHPAAPLTSIVALVEVYTLEGASASAPFVALLHRLGAKTTRSWSDRITHVVFKDGSPTTLQRVRLNNKDFEETGKGNLIHCVNSRWVTDCETEGARVDESEEAYVVDVADIPRGGKRRRKSMEPAALLNLGGNIVRDRKSSGNRVSSFGRSPLKSIESPAKKGEEILNVTPVPGDVVGKENSGDERSSPVTPAWISAPGQLVQQTAPMKRVRKLELPGKEEAKSRRLTFWNGAA